MGFHDVRFPVALSFGAFGGPERRCEIVTLANGFEERNSPWAHARRRYDAGLGLRALEDVETVMGFFEARRGPLFGFRWKDWLDFRSAPAARPVEPLDQQIGFGDDTTTAFQLVKRYGDGPSPYLRPIAKPIAGSVRVAVGGDEIGPGEGVEVDHATGLVRFAVPPAMGEIVTAGFEFDVPARFDTETLSGSVAGFRAGTVPEIPVVEIRL
ncbi:phage distal tail protein, Rcc01695 family [Limimaricola sp. AA108-03]|uniref:phage distal tail protein, Rcc01695 family n=1 Tax=Limimaricola sp. AA108-03 TaxID=3425945 RepID=UPI003D788B84